MLDSSFKTIDKISSQDLEGKKVLVRADLNVPLNRYRDIVDDTRIRAVIPTIEYLRKKGAKIILCSHLGRPKGEFKYFHSLATVAERLSLILMEELIFCEDCFGDEVKETIKNMTNNEIILLENLRFYSEEIENDPGFALALAENFDVYINDAFATSHRSHSSCDIITNYFNIYGAGLLMEKEIKSLEKVRNNPDRPLAAIIGGAKLESKITVIKNLLDICDKLLLGGGMIYTFYQAHGYYIGKSRVEKNYINLVKELEEIAKAKGVEILLPIDLVVTDNISLDGSYKNVNYDNIPEDWIGVDIGKASIKMFQEALSNCQTIVWNGTMGLFRYPQYAKGTSGIAYYLGELTQNKGVNTIIGGGNLVAAINSLNLKDKMSYISTGGGAMLDFISGKKLPALVALNYFSK